MNSLSRHMLRSIVVLPVLATLTGCTVAGYFMGRGFDDPREFPEPVPLDKPITLKEGTDLLVKADTDSVYRGRYFGLHRQPGDSYRAGFVRWRDSVGVGFFPVVPGDTVVLFTEKVGTRQNVVRAVFVGIDGSAILVKHPDARDPLPILVSRIGTLSDTRGHSIDNEPLTRLVAEHAIPFESAVALRLEEGVILIPLNDVTELALPPRDGIVGRVVFTSIGIAVDLLWISAVVNAEPSDGFMKNWHMP